MSITSPKRETAWWPLLGMVPLAIGLLVGDGPAFLAATFGGTTVGAPFVVLFLDWRRRKRERLPAEATARIGHRR
jgi:hypothetical protein